MTAPDRSRVRRLLRRTLGDVFALGYLAVCAALLVWAFVATALDDSGESMAGVIPLLATAPTGFVLFLLLPEGLVPGIAALVAGALVNAVVIGWCARTLRRGDRPDRAS
ncbi:hypothetical protein GCM10019016_075580 [Streptomyces prasinosporus]|uniref:Integral membrane protein n=1 Tax=Streptomyces prasinosporus TaxID=68256 RepID=A0ABP6TYI7_9ACTN